MTQQLNAAEQKVVDFLARHKIINFTQQAKQMTVAQKRRLRKRLRAANSDRFKGMLEQL